MENSIARRGKQTKSESQRYEANNVTMLDCEEARNFTELLIKFLCEFDLVEHEKHERRSGVGVKYFPLKLLMSFGHKTYSFF